MAANMSDRPFCASLLAMALYSFACAFAQAPVTNNAAGHDFSKQGVVLEQLTTKVAFQSDGTNTREQHARVRVQSEAGVQQYSVLRPSYQASFEHIEALDVRVTKSNGSVMVTPLDSIQDVAPEAYRAMASYTDLREKDIPVKGLEPGDTLEYFVRWQTDHPLAKDQFWFGHQFTKNTIVLDEQLEVSVPRGREVNLKSQTIQPSVREETGRRIYSWKTSNLESESVEQQREVLVYNAMRGSFPTPDVLISSFRTWDELGRWYEGLQQERIRPSTEIKAKAEDLTKNLEDDDAKLHAIYNYVSLHFHYIGISFGIGRYQPHLAAEILGNQFGDCKDKHTLLAALLSAIGIQAYPALISSWATVDADVPSPGQFNHLISVVERRGGLVWMDTTPEIAPLGYLAYPLRGKAALVIAPGKIAFQTTPKDPPFANRYVATLTARLAADGTLQAHVVTTERGDAEFSSRSTFRRAPQSQWKDLTQQISYGAQLGGTISDVQATAPERTEEPFTLTYSYTLKDFAGGDKHRFAVPLPALGIPRVKDEDLERTRPLWIGYPGEMQYESRIDLPAGWSATTTIPVDFNESFAEYQGKSELREGALVTKRRLVLKSTEVQPEQIKSYKAFQKAVSDDQATYIFLRVPGETVSTSRTQNVGYALPATSSIWTDTEKADFRFCVSQISTSERESALQRSTHTAACAMHEEQQHWMTLHPQAATKKEDKGKLEKCLHQHISQMKETAEGFHAALDLCLCKAYGLPKPKQ